MDLFEAVTISLKVLKIDFNFDLTKLSDRFLHTQYDTTIETYSTLDYNSILTVDSSTRRTWAGSVDPPNPRHALELSVDSSSAA